MPPRTKACAICRKKRIKCDATLPQCLMCIRTNKQCPGPVEGALIIDMSKSASKSTRKKRSDANEAKLMAMGQQPFVLTKHVDQVAAINESFYAKFLTHFEAKGEGNDLQNKRTWMHDLPSLSTDGKNRALAPALYASAFAFCGMETANPALLQNAWKIYGQALAYHAQIIKSRPKEVTVHMVSTSVMLSVFEAMQATTADAYRLHIFGAARMIEAAGPVQCRDGVLCQLFWHVRTQLSIIYLATRQGRPLPVKKILLETLNYQRLPVFQRLLSHLATLSVLYHSTDTAESEQHLLTLETYERIKSELEALWFEYKWEADTKDEQLSYVIDTHQTVYRDAFTALTISHFASASALLNLLAPLVSYTYTDPIDHHAIILDCAEFVQVRKSACSMIRMATPLFIVAKHSPKKEQRREATDIFENWKKDIMTGISMLALDGIYDRPGSTLEV